MSEVGDGMNAIARSAGSLRKGLVVGWFERMRFRKGGKYVSKSGGIAGVNLVVVKGRKYKSTNTQEREQENKCVHEKKEHPD